VLNDIFRLNYGSTPRVSLAARPVLCPRRAARLKACCRPGTCSAADETLLAVEVLRAGGGHRRAAASRVPVEVRSRAVVE
jgi:hypothetical protein